MKIELCLFLVLVLTTCVVSSRSNDQEILNHLKRLNKPAVKSIKSSDGDIIDCVNLADQPAFDHPLLKNHMIQLSPTHDPDSGNNKQSENEEGPEPITQLWQLNGTCPQGTVPIIRTTKSDLLRASSLEEFGKKANATVSRPGFSQHIVQSRFEHAIASVKGGAYYGTKANLNVWKPYVQNNEFSSSRIWLGAGSYPPSDVIEAGWHVDPQANGDRNTRFFTYWLSDGYTHQGCYNTRCSGFVQTNNKIALGATLHPVSIYNKNMQSIDLAIWKDQHTNNWWLKYGKTVIGYWPWTLFGLLDQIGASEVHWGGEVLNRPSRGLHTLTDMGSGRFAEGGWQKASFIRNIQVADESGNFKDPLFLDTDAKNSGCYNVKAFENGGFTWGKHIFFGGPGRNSKCP